MIRYSAGISGGRNDCRGHSINTEMKIFADNMTGREVKYKLKKCFSIRENNFFLSP